MFLNTQQVYRLQTALTNAASLNLKQRQQADKELNNLRAESTYPLLLFTFIQNQTSNHQLALRASIQFKIWSSSYKVLQQCEVLALQSTVDQVKKNIISFYVATQDKISAQLLQVIINIAARDFFYKWPSLISQIGLQANGNYSRLLRSLKVLKKVTARYSYQFRSDPLYQQIIFVCDNVHSFFLSICQQVLKDSILTSDPLCYKVLKTLMKIFYNLNYQDLHPHFQDNLQIWMSIVTQVMKLQRQIKGYSLIKLKGSAMQGLILFANKYRDDIGPLIIDFTNHIWQLCKSKISSEHQQVLTSGLKYFRSLVYWKDMQAFFLTGFNQIIKCLIIPQLIPSKTQQQLLQDQIQVFYQKLFSRSDINTTRSSAVDLLQSLTRHFKPVHFYQDLIISIAKQIQSGSVNTLNIVLLCNVLVDGLTSTFRAQDGCIQTHLPVQIILSAYQKVVRVTFNMIFTFLQTGKTLRQVFPQFHFAYILRFVSNFRNHLPKEDIVAVISLLSLVLKSSSGNLRFITAAVLSGLINYRINDLKQFSIKIYLFNQSNHKFLMQSCNPIFQLIQLQPMNPYLNLCLKNLIEIIKGEIFIYFRPFCNLFNGIIKQIHSFSFDRVFQIFDALGTLIKYSINKQVDIMKVIQDQMLQTFNNILKSGKDISNFIFQILAIIAQNSNSVPKLCNDLLLSVLEKSNWIQDNSSLFLSYIAYLRAYSKRKPDIYIQFALQIQQIIKSLVSLGKDYSLFALMTNIILHLEFQKMLNSGWFRFIIQVAINLYSQVANNQLPYSQKKSVRPAINKYLLTLISLLFRVGPVEIILLQTNKLRHNILLQILVRQRIIISTIQRRQRKIIFNGISKLLFDANISRLISRQIWIQLFSALIDNFMNQRLIWLSLKQQQINIEDQSFKKLKQLQIQYVDLKQDQQKILVSNYINNLQNIKDFRVGQLLSQQRHIGLNKLIARKQNQI